MKTFIYGVIYYLSRLKFEIIADYGELWIQSTPRPPYLAISWEEKHEWY